MNPHALSGTARLPGCDVEVSASQAGSRRTSKSTFTGTPEQSPCRDQSHALIRKANIDEAGFGLVGSAVQNAQRLIVVVNGLKTARERAQEACKLLEWGFRAFEVRQVFTEGEIVGEASVFGGAKGRVSLKAKGAVSLLVPPGSSERLNARIVYRGPLAVPLQEGAEVARLLVTRGEVKTLDIPLYVAESVEPGSLQRRALDALLEAATGWVRKALGRS